MPVVMVPKVLQEKLGDDGTQALIDLLDAWEKASHSNLLEDIDAKMSQHLADLSQRLEGLRGDLIREITSSRAEMIKWMFIFWAGQAVVLAGLLWRNMH